jgi:glycosyltransferase involved in cell wall biosynthesis
LDLYFDAKRYFYNRTGLGNYSRWLVHAYHGFFPEDHIHLLNPALGKKLVEPWIEQANLTKVDYPAMGGLYRSILLGRRIPDQAIYHGLSGELPINLKDAEKRAVVTIHDVIFKIRPQDYKWHDRWSYDLKTRFALRTAARVLAISHTTRNDLIERYHADPDRIEVVYQNCDPVFYQENKAGSGILERLALPSEFWLCVGSFNPRKNQQSILNAWEQIKPDQRIPILFIGEGGSKKEFRKICEEKKLESWCFFPKVEYKTDLANLYRLSVGLIYPSLCEGFGIPAVEALASGVPVLGHKGTSVEEAAGPGGVFLDTTHAQDMAAGILKIQDDPSYRKDLCARGKEHIAPFKESVTMPKLKKLYGNLGK